MIGIIDLIFGSSISEFFYKSILKFYKVDISALSSKDIKAKAEHYLAVKLCKCIKNIKITHDQLNFN